MVDLSRYSRIKEKFPRELVLLQGTGCIWKKCTFCDYFTDMSPDPYPINAPVLQMVTGESGVLDVINSGSAPELDDRTLDHIAALVREKSIHTLWFEAHYLYRRKLADFARRFTPATVKFRCGVESFSPRLRAEWRKGITPTVTPRDIARHYKGITLLACVQGQTPEEIKTDIALARQYFEYASINIFTANSTPVRRDDNLFRWFMQEIYPAVANDPHFEILLNNTDLGVG